MDFEKSEDTKRAEFAAAAEQLERVTLAQFETLLGSPFGEYREFPGYNTDYDHLQIVLTISAHYGIIATEVTHFKDDGDEFVEREAYTWSLLDDERHPVWLAAGVYRTSYSGSLPPMSRLSTEHRWVGVRMGESLDNSFAGHVPPLEKTNSRKKHVQPQLGDPWTWTDPDTVEWPGRMAAELSDDTVIVSVENQPYLDELKNAQLPVHLECHRCRKRVENPFSADNKNHAIRIPLREGKLVCCQDHARDTDPRVTDVEYHRDLANFPPEWFEPTEVDLPGDGPPISSFSTENRIVCTECNAQSSPRPVGPVVDEQVAHCCPECESLVPTRIREASFEESVNVNENKNEQDDIGDDHGITESSFYNPSL